MNKTAFEKAWIACSGRCTYCGLRIPKEAATRDHAVPKKLGGRDSKTNIVIACYPCNARKGARSAEWFLGSSWLRHRILMIKKGVIEVIYPGDKLRKRRDRPSRTNDALKDVV